MNDEPDNESLADEFFDDELNGIDTEGVGKRVADIFRETLKAQENAEMLKAQLETEESVINTHKNKTLPDLLALLGTDIWRDPVTGLTVELKTAVNSTLPKDQDKRNALLENLRPLGVEQIMAEEFTILFSPNDVRAHAIRAILGLQEQQVLEDAPTDTRLTNSQHELIHQLRVELGLETLPASEKLGVNGNTFKAWLKRLIDGGKGKEISEAGIWHGKFAEIEKPKKGKK